MKTLTIICFIYALSACTSPSNNLRPQALSFPYSAQSYAPIQDYRQLAESVKHFYVKVSIQIKQAEPDRHNIDAAKTVSGASGIIMNAQGLVITAAHIAQNTALQAKITTMEGQVYNADILYVDQKHELALLKINAPGALFSEPIVSKSIQAQEAVFAIGTPDNKAGVVSVGRVNNPILTQHFDYGAYGFDKPISLAMKVEPGHSGGPVFNARGALIGMIVAFDLRINSAGDYDATGTAYAIPIKEIMNFVDNTLSQ